MKFRFVAAERSQFPVSLLCKAIGVTRPGIQPAPSVDVFWSLTAALIG